MSVTLSEAALLKALTHWQLNTPIRCTSIPGGFTSNVWYVDTPTQRFVAKYCYDTQSAFDEGLRAAEALSHAGIVCATPVHTLTGELSMLVEGPHGRFEPLALLGFVPGTPLNWMASGAPQIAGQFLGRIHAQWQRASHLRIQDRIFSYLAESTPEVATQAGLQALIDQAIAHVRQFEVETHVTYGPIVGDYVEILHDASTGSIGLIDCGAVNWGPLLFDIAIMINAFPQGSAEKQQFLEAYVATAPIQPDELGGVHHYEALHWAQLAKYFAWRLAHNVTIGDDDLEASAHSLTEIRAALELSIANA